PSLSIVFGLSSKTQWLSGLYYADFISFYSPTQLCGGGTTKSNSNELPISVPLSFFRKTFRNLAKNSRIEEVNHRENGSCYELVSIAIRGLTGLSRRIVYMGLYHCRVSHRFFL
ncbi:MAG: hypothetical protein KH097_07725, partial [Streptococcus parasanguinis]|nr:hypothetical protein [Streptococcus parasanguinis]